MARLRVAWRSVYEPSWDEVRVISPRDASLYVFPADFWASDDCARRLPAIGLHPRERVPELPDEIVAADRLPSASGRAGVALERSGFGAVGLAARAVGLRRFLEWMACRPQHDARRSVDDVLATVKSWEGPRHGTQCLARSILRWSLLLRAGHRPSLVLGVASPTARMHAWITLGDRHVGEDPDEVAAYWPAVRYEVDRAAAGN